MTSALLAATVLARYSFDAGKVLETGPDSFAVFKVDRGDVALSPGFRVSGDASVELRDRPHDNNFPELQGYFPARSSGLLEIRFALMTTDPTNPCHVALAGPAHFRLAKDGIALWLKIDDGVLRHVSDGIPRRLVPIRSFAWYFFRIRYDLDEGRYDLTVWEENNEHPLVSLRNQLNAVAAAGSVIDKFSFVGDVENDRAASNFFVDDIAVEQAEPCNPPESCEPPRYPGRRELFVTRWLDRDQASEAERAGDAFYRDQDWARASDRYAEALALSPHDAIVWLKLSDMALLLGDFDRERACRERVFGTLRSD
jgi:hypothetical protein